MRTSKVKTILYKIDVIMLIVGTHSDWFINDFDLFRIFNPRGMERRGRMGRGEGPFFYPHQPISTCITLLSLYDYRRNYKDNNL